jgi:hypothetical protein
MGPQIILNNLSLSMHGSAVISLKEILKKKKTELGY